MMHANQLCRMTEINTSVMMFALIEANMGWDKSSEYARYLSQMSVQWNFYTDPKDRNPLHVGFTTTESTKSAMVTSTSAKLVSNSIRFHKDIFSSGSKDPQILLNELFFQIANFKRAVKNPLDKMFQSSRVSFSGKEGGRKDDLVMTLMIFLHYSSLVVQQQVLR